MPVQHDDQDQSQPWLRDWGGFLRAARQIAGLSLTDLSARSSLSKGYLSKLESGQAGARNPSRATLAALARALPSFRPLALMLEPGMVEGTLALATAAPDPPAHAVAYATDATAEGTPVEDAPPLALSWRELEVLVVLLVLERAATLTPPTAVVVARAVGREVTPVRQVLARLATMWLIEAVPPARRGTPPAYRLLPSAASDAGLERVGDALVLAGALLARAPLLGRHGAAPR